MAKPNNNNFNKKRDNFFKKELSGYRSSAPINFMANKDNMKRNKDCKSICKDIASGNIDIRTEAGYFLQPELIDQLITFTNSKVWYHNRIASCVSAIYNQEQQCLGPNAVDPPTLAIIAEHDRSKIAYQILRDGFMAIKAQGNPEGWLVTMISQLTAGRYAGNI